MSALWIQDIQDREGATYMKVLGTESPADLVTKYLTREKVGNAIDKMSQVVQEGRAHSSLDIQGKAYYLRETYDLGDTKEERVAQLESHPRRVRFAETTSESRARTHDETHCNPSRNAVTGQQVGWGPTW